MMDIGSITWGCAGNIAAAAGAAAAATEIEAGKKGRKRALSEILDIDQYSTRVNLNLDNSGLGLGWIRDEVFADEYVVEAPPPDGSYRRLDGWPTSTPNPAPSTSTNKSPTHDTPVNVNVWQAAMLTPTAISSSNKSPVNPGLNNGWTTSAPNSEDSSISNKSPIKVPINGWHAATPVSNANKSPIRILPNNAFMTTPSPTRTKVYSAIPKKYEYECVFCKGNDEPDYVYKTHPIRINDTVICPALRKHVCQICGATGDIAHTVKYCPYNNRGFYAGLRQQQQLHQQAAANDMTPLGKQPQASAIPPRIGETYGNRSTMMNGFGFSGAGAGSNNGKKPVVRKLNFDEPSIPASKSTAGFFKNMQQLQNLKISNDNGNGGAVAGTFSDTKNFPFFSK